MKFIHHSKDQVQICNKTGCINATGKFAEIITIATVVTILLIGISAVIKAAN